MFLDSSRYASIDTIVVTRTDGQSVTAVKLRRLPNVDGDPLAVDGTTRLDVIALRNYQDATMFWHVGDANADLETARLVSEVGRVISVPAT
ncbi:MAG: hypothetical protein ACREND_02860 [Gemmatimonadaceae bacterium]